MRRARARVELDTVSEGENAAIFRPPARKPHTSASTPSEGWDDPGDKLNILIPPIPLARLPDSFANIPPSGQADERRLPRAEGKLVDLLQRNTRMAQELNKLRDDNTQLHKEIRRLRQLQLALPLVASKHSEAQTSPFAMATRSPSQPRAPGSQMSRLGGSKLISGDDLSLGFTREHALQYPSPDRVATQLFVERIVDSATSATPTVSTPNTQPTSGSSISRGSRSSSGRSRHSRSTGSSGTIKASLYSSQQQSSSSSVSGKWRRCTSPIESPRAGFPLAPMLASPPAQQLQQVLRISSPEEPRMHHAQLLTNVVYGAAIGHNSMTHDGLANVNVSAVSASSADMSVSTLLEEVATLEDSMDTSSQWMDMSISLSESFLQGTAGLGGESLEANASGALTLEDAPENTIAFEPEDAMPRGAYYAKTYEIELSPVPAARQHRQTDTPQPQPLHSRTGVGTRLDTLLELNFSPNTRQRAQMSVMLQERWLRQQEKEKEKKTHIKRHAAAQAQSPMRPPSHPGTIPRTQVEAAAPVSARPSRGALQMAARMDSLQALLNPTSNPSHGAL